MRTVSPTPADLDVVGAHLPRWDHVDAFETLVTGGVPDSALSAARCLLDPSTAGRLVLRARDRCVRVVGLQPTVTTGQDDLFPVLSETPDLVVLGLDDRHLDFRILVSTSDGRVRCTTAVRRHNRLGHAYFAVVRPFHRRLVPWLLARSSRRGWSPRAGSSVAPALPLGR